MKQILFPILMTFLLAAAGCGKKEPPKTAEDTDKDANKPSLFEREPVKDDGKRDEVQEDPAATKEERKKLLGNWVSEYVEENGKELDEREGKQFRFFDDDLNILDAAGKVLAKGTCKLDTSQEVRRLDLRHQKGSSQDAMTPKGPILVEKITRAIYTWEEGNTLKICLAEPGAARPADFTTRPDSGRILLHLKRQ